MRLLFLELETLHLAGFNPSTFASGIKSVFYQSRGGRFLHSINCLNLSDWERTSLTSPYIRQERERAPHYKCLTSSTPPNRLFSSGFIGHLASLKRPSSCFDLSALTYLGRRILLLLGTGTGTGTRTGTHRIPSQHADT
jgi:hypothetical protein